MHQNGALPDNINMSALHNIKKMALIVGNGEFPVFLSKTAKALDIDLVMIKIKNEATADLGRYSDKIYSIELGEGRKLLDILKRENIQYLTLAGKIKKTTIFQQAFKMDEVVKGVLKNVFDKRDDTIVKTVEQRLKKEGIILINSTLFLKDFMAKKQNYTRKKPTLIEKQDIAFGFKMAKAIGGLDIGQTVAVKQKAVVAVEAIEGTDQAIIRAGQITPGVVVVKTSKPDQNMRYDIPTIGINTIKTMIKAKASVLAIESEKVLILNKDLVVKKANKAGICVVAV